MFLGRPQMIQKDRVAIITGAAGNLGSVLARSLAGQGVRLALFGTSASRLERLASDLDLPGDRVLVGAFDLTAPGAAHTAANMVMEKFGRADILAHLVGGWTGGKSVAVAPASDL